MALILGAEDWVVKPQSTIPVGVPIGLLVEAFEEPWRTRCSPRGFPDLELLLWSLPSLERVDTGRSLAAVVVTKKICFTVCIDRGDL